MDDIDLYLFFLSMIFSEPNPHDHHHIVNTPSDTKMSPMDAGHPPQRKSCAKKKQCEHTAPSKESRSGQRSIQQEAEPGGWTVVEDKVMTFGRHIILRARNLTLVRGQADIISRLSKAWLSILQP